MTKTALIIGTTGQDGSCLAELLLEKGQKEHGLKRRSSSFNTSRIDHLYDNPNFKAHFGDPSNSTNQCAMSHVAFSFEEPEYSADIDGNGTLRLLEAIRINKPEKNIGGATISENVLTC